MRDIAQPAFDAPASDWMVYGDALQEAGDPRGELIALASNPTARDAYVAANWGALVGDVPRDEVELVWHYGIAERAIVRPRMKPGSKFATEAMSKLVASRVAPDVRALELRGVGTIDLAPAMTALARKLPPQCTRFAFVDERATQSEMLVSRDFEPPANLVAFGSFDALWPIATELTIDCADAEQLVLGAMHAPALRVFALRCLRFGDYDNVEPIADQLDEVEFPACESFELRCVETWTANVPEERKPYVAVYSSPEFEGRDDTDDGETDGIDWGALDGLLHALAKSPLRRLALTSFASTQSMLDAIAAAGLPPTLRELDLSDSAISDTDVGWILQHSALFAKLERLVLTNTPLTARAVKTIAELGPRVVHSPGLGATYRYVVGAE